MRAIATILFVFYLMQTTSVEAKLSRSDATLLDAFAFVMMGLEEGQAPGAAIPTRRTVRESSVEFFQPAQNPNPADNTLYGVWVDESSPDECVFVLKIKMNIPPQMLPKGVPAPDNTTVKYDLNRMSKFEIRTFPLNATARFFAVWLEGTQVYCDKDQCKDKNGVDMSLEYNQLKTQALQAEFSIRRERAIEFIKKSCPGKPY